MFKDVQGFFQLNHLARATGPTTGQFDVGARSSCNCHRMGCGVQLDPWEGFGGQIVMLTKPISL